MLQNHNPLSQFFRQPAIYLRLPSQGQGWADGALDLPANGEIPILPMTAMDEITYRTPDALFNGEAVVTVIQSCAPNIRDAWAIPITDLDSILVAIRIASYGHDMEIGTQCPKCKEESNFGLDLRTVIDKLTAPDYTQSLSMGDLEIHFRPLNYRETTQSNLVQFEQQKTMQILNDADASEASKVEQLNVMMKKIVEVTMAAIAQSIGTIRTPSATIHEQEYILDFLKNCDRTMFNRIRDYVISLRQQAELKPLKLSCSACSEKYEQAFTLDMANFFGSAS